MISRVSPLLLTVALLAPLNQALVHADKAKPKKALAAKKAAVKPDPHYKLETNLEAQFGGQIDAKTIAAIKKGFVAPPPASMKVPAKARVVLHTSKGDVTVELNGTKAPLTVKSFLYLAGRKFYDGTVFHRHADLLGDGTGYIIQGGDPLSKNATTKEMAGIGGPGYTVPLESNDLTHNKFVIAMARSNDPNSAGSQFYITQGAVHFLDKQYAVFGTVVKGSDVAAKLDQGTVLKRAEVLR